MIRSASLTLGILLAIGNAGNATGQTRPSPDEQQIRALVAAEEAGKRPPRTDDQIFWSGAYRRPVVGSERGELLPGEEQQDRITESQRSKSVIRRIEIAKSGEMAYEYSDGVLSFDLKNGRHVSFPRSVLRVWRKENGQWMVAASFSHGHDVTRPQ